MEEIGLSLKRSALFGALVVVSTALVLTLCTAFVEATAWGTRGPWDPWVFAWAWRGRAVFFAVVALVQGVSLGSTRFLSRTRLPAPLLGAVSALVVFGVSLQTVYTFVLVSTGSITRALECIVGLKEWLGWGISYSRFFETALFNPFAAIAGTSCALALGRRRGLAPLRQLALVAVAVGAASWLVGLAHESYG